MFSSSTHYQNALLTLDLDLLIFLSRDLTTYHSSKILKTVILH